MNEQQKAILDNLESIKKSFNLAIETTASGTVGQQVFYFPQRSLATNSPSPLYSQFLLEPVQPLFEVKNNFSFQRSLNIGETGAAPSLSVQELQCPVEVNYENFDITFGIGKLWVYRAYSAERVIQEFNRRALANNLGGNNRATAWIESVNSIIMTELMRDIEKNLKTGRPAASNQWAIAGLDFQMEKVNTVIPAAGASNARYNNVTYNAGNNQAFMEDVSARIQHLIYQHGVQHVVIMIPVGTANKFRAAWDQYSSSSSILRFMEVGINGPQDPADGSYTSMYGDNYRFRLNDKVDLLEVPGFANGEVYVYPDRINDEYGFQEYKYTVARPGNVNQTILTEFYATSDEMFDYVGLNANELQAYKSHVWEGANRCDGMAISKKWRGQFIYKHIGFATKYTAVTFLTGVSFTTLGMANTGNVDMTQVA